MCFFLPIDSRPPSENSPVNNSQIKLSLNSTEIKITESVSDVETSENGKLSKIGCSTKTSENSGILKTSENGKFKVKGKVKFLDNDQIKTSENVSEIVPITNEVIPLNISEENEILTDDRLNVRTAAKEVSLPTSQKQSNFIDSESSVYGQNQVKLFDNNVRKTSENGNEIVPNIISDEKQLVTEETPNVSVIEKETSPSKPEKPSYSHDREGLARGQKQPAIIRVHMVMKEVVDEFANGKVFLEPSFF